MKKRSEILTIAEAARRIGVSRQALHQAVTAGRVKVVKVQVERSGIAPEDLELYSQSRKQEECPSES